MQRPEDAARVEIDKALSAAGWDVQDPDKVNLHASLGVAVREFPLKQGHGFADYLLYVDAQAVGVVEAKQVGTTLTGVEVQTEKYSVGLPDHVPAWTRPLPYLFQSTGVEHRFTNRLDPEARSRRVFHFHKPETLREWILTEVQETFPASAGKGLRVASPSVPYRPEGFEFNTLRSRIRHMPPIIQTGMWPAQIKAITNLEKSLAQDKPRALIQMATGSGKTFTSVSSIYRLIKYGKAKRVLFLVDRGNLAEQTEKEFQQYITPDDGRKFTELYNVQRLTSNKIDGVSKVVITTIQRLYSMLRGEEQLADEELEEKSLFTMDDLRAEPLPVEYNPSIPIESFDFIFTDECHRSIYNLWRQVLEYFDSYLIGLTATPSKQTLGFFNKNLVMEYNHEMAVADGVNVDFDVYRIRTQITEGGSKVDAGYYVDKRDRDTRALRWEKLDDDLLYLPNQLDRDVVARDQIRTVIQTFRDKLFTEIFPGRTEVPKTLIFAKDDSHADDIVQMIREEFGKGNDFCEKITYKTGTARIIEKVKDENGKEIEKVTYKSTNVKPKDLLQAFRNSYNPRIAVTVDMIATGTDIKPLEIVMFMRTVKSLNFFEQMKGRGVRVISDSDLQSVTPDAHGKTHFVIVDAVGATETKMSDTKPLDTKRTVEFEKLLDAVSFGSTDPDILSSLVSRIARLEKQLNEKDRDQIASLTNGQSLKEIGHGILAAIDPDKQVEFAKQKFNLSSGQSPSEAQLTEAANQLVREAVKPISGNPQLRSALLEIKKDKEQTIDNVSTDSVLSAGFSTQAKESAQKLISSFKQYIEDHKDEITAVQVLYSRPYKHRLKFEDIKALADQLGKPPRSWTPDRLWKAYEILEQSKVKGSGGKILTDIVSLVRFAIDEKELRPFKDLVEERYRNWLTSQVTRGTQFTPEQLEWLALIKDHVAANLSVEKDDFEYAPFNQRGGLGRLHQVFGTELHRILTELNEVLVA